MTLTRLSAPVIAASLMTLAAVANGQVADKSASTPSEQFPADACISAPDKTKITGLVTGIGPNWGTVDNIGIAFIPDGHDKVTFQYSIYGPDSDLGRSHIATLLTAYTTGTKVYIWCHGPSVKKFGSVWLGQG